MDAILHACLIDLYRISGQALFPPISEEHTVKHGVKLM